MKVGRPSRTSEGNTAVRAKEMRRPAAERICHDPYAEYFLGPFYQRLRKYPLLSKAYGWLGKTRFPGLSGGILARARYIDERLAASLDEGIEQLVILGAGNDTRAYRLGAKAEGLAVFEVDHPSTQQAKLAKLHTLFGTIPPHVAFVPVDFCRDDLGAQLCAAGYHPSKKTLFIWEGVIYYLNAAAVDALLTFVTGNSGNGSSILFDYFPPSVIDGTSEHREARNLRKRVARFGEPFTFGIDDREIEQFLQDRGFHEMEVVGAAACKKAWFHGVNQTMKVSEMFRFVHARHFATGGDDGNGDQ
jgi:methyltransferase (TIGR00027 family)